MSLKYASYLAMFIISLLILNTRRRILQMLHVLFASSGIIAIYSVINVVSEGKFNIFDSIPPWTADWSKAGHGTFSYQNHYTSFLTLTIPLGFALIYESMRGNNNASDKNTGRTKQLQMLDFFLLINTVYLLSMFIMICALITTLSRGGNLIFILSNRQHRNQWD